MSVILTSMDGERVEITRKAAKQSELLKAMLVDDDDEEEDAEIPLPLVPADLLQLIGKFLVYHSDNPMRKIPKPIPSIIMSDLVDEFDVNLVDLDITTVCRLCTAVNYMDIPDMLDLSVAKFCTFIKGKNTDEIKELLNIKGDITPEEEREVREKNDWIFQFRKPDNAAAG